MPLYMYVTCFKSFQISDGTTYILILLLQLSTPFKALYLLGCLLQICLIPIRILSLRTAYILQTVHPSYDLEKLLIAEEIVLIWALPATSLMVFHYVKWAILAVIQFMCQVNANGSMFMLKVSYSLSPEISRISLQCSWLSVGQPIRFCCWSIIWYFIPIMKKIIQIFTIMPYWYQSKLSGQTRGTSTHGHPYPRHLSVD
mgnify:CR=1 FL=1